MPNEDEWRILAEEAAQEKDPKRLLEIVNALNAAIDRQQQRPKQTEPPARPLSQNAGKPTKQPSAGRHIHPKS